MLAGLALAVSAASEARAWPEEPPALILLIGNSHSNGVKRNLERLFEAAGVDVKIKNRSRGGWTLERHARSKGTLKRIGKKPWDIVVLQEQSQGIWSERYGGARVLDATIRTAGARTMFFMTFRREGDPPGYYDNLLGTVGGTFGYVPIAWELDASIAPVGWAFRTAVAEGLGLDLWKDGRHASKLGSYLATCVFYAAMTGPSPEGLPARLSENTSASDIAAVQELAARVALSRPNDWNLPDF